jgi:hypothetical protein
MADRFLRMLAWAALCGACAGRGAVPAPADSAEMLRREPVTERAEVLHVLVGWKELEPAYGGRMDERAKTRTKQQADVLAGEILHRARSGEAFRSLMKAHSEDWASAQQGTSYTATPAAQLVPPFKALALRLAPGETGVVETVYGWHVIQRIE